MDPPSPSKFPMSPGMPLFPVSPERMAGSKPPYGTPQSPSLQGIRMSPLRSSHRRNDSDVSVQGLAARFETLDVKDHREAQQKFAQAIEKIQLKHANEIRLLENQYQERLSRQEVRIEQMLEAERAAKQAKENVVSKDDWDKQRKEYREAQKKWEAKANEVNDLRKQAERKAHEYGHENKVLSSKVNQYKKRCIELSKEMITATGQIPHLQADMQSMKRERRRLESDLKFHTSEAEMYKNQVYGLQVDLESVEARLSEEVQTLKEKLGLVEGERDALKTSLKEEEVLRIAAEGQIPLPAATTDEHDDFESPVRSPVRSPRKQRNPERDEEDKENVAPRKGAVDLKFLRQELAAERRLREQVQDQVEFMKMECQFQCCSCRIADLKGSKYIHDNAYDAEMERIKASVPEMTPPPSSHGDDPMEGVVTKEEPTDNERSISNAEHSEQPGQCEPTMLVEEFTEQPSGSAEGTFNTIAYPVSPPCDAETEMAFSPTTGTFRAVPSPVKVPSATHIATPAKPSGLGLSSITHVGTTSSPWAPDDSGTIIHHDDASLVQLDKQDRNPDLMSVSQSSSQNKAHGIFIHEDAIEDSDEENEPKTPLHGPTGPETPAQYLTRTITTTTTIPIHFSPMTPAVHGVDRSMTPSTVAHAPTAAQSNVLGEISFNKLPFDREAALEAIRERRGRARSMAAGQGTPMKQMMDGVKERRDISAPVSRVQR